jgi:hypothetical protein
LKLGMYTGDIACALRKLIEQERLLGQPGLEREPLLRE